jgi:glycosyltransferase involved in cell wall biosynthesis
MSAPAGSRPADRDLWVFDDAPILGGSEIFALRLGRFAQRRGSPSVRIVCPAESEMARRCRDYGIEHLSASFPELGPRGAARWPGAVLAIRALLRRIGPHSIAIGNTARAQGYLTAAAPLTREGPRIVHLMHEQETLRRRSGRFALRRVGALVAVGGNIAAACSRALPGIEIREANLFLDPNEMAEPLARDRDGEEPVIGVLTRLIPEKGILELLDQLASTGGWSRAEIAGSRQDEAYAGRVEARIAAPDLSDRISLLDHVSDLRSFFGSIDVLISPPTGTEGQGMGVVEALWHDRPALVRRGAFSARDFEGLPVWPYDSADELGSGLGRVAGAVVPADEVRRRFGPAQALDAILAAGGMPS